MVKAVLPGLTTAVVIHFAGAAMADSLAGKAGDVRHNNALEKYKLTAAPKCEIAA